jgi:opacity protein-like surface antigen
MKNTITVLILGLLLSSGFKAKAQPGVVVNAGCLYTFAERFPGYDAEFRINDGEAWYASLGVILHEAIEVNFSYQIQKTVIDEKSYGLGLTDGSYNSTISYYQLGFNRYFSVPANDKIIPYSGLKIGIGDYRFETNKYENQTKLGIGLNLGLKYMFTEKIGINLVGQIQMPVTGFGLYIGTGGVGAGTSSYIFQLALGGGLVYRLK